MNRIKKPIKEWRMPNKKVWNEKMETLSREDVKRIRLRRLMFQLYRVQSKVEFVPPEALGRVTKKTPMFEEKFR
jgi:hypothetical protein